MIDMIRMTKMKKIIKIIKVKHLIKLINIIQSIKITLCIDDKYVKDDKDDNDYSDDEYNDVNEHPVKLDCDKTDQSNEVNDNNPDFQSHVCPLGQVHDKLLWGRFRHPEL